MIFSGLGLFVLSGLLGMLIGWSMGYDDGIVVCIATTTIVSGLPPNEALQAITFANRLKWNAGIEHTLGFQLKKPTLNMQRKSFVNKYDL